MGPKQGALLGAQSVRSDSRTPDIGGVEALWGKGGSTTSVLGAAIIDT